MTLKEKIKEYVDDHYKYYDKIEKAKKKQPDMEW